MNLPRSAGFTLVEMVAVIVISGILAGVVWRNISQPITGFEDATRRVQLVDVAETALHRITSEIRLAAPNSLRLTSTGATFLSTCTASAGTPCAIEILRTLTGGRYRAQADITNNVVCASGDGDTLNFNVASDCFQVLGTLVNFGTIVTGATQADCLSNAAACLVIFNTGQTGANAYAGDNIAVVTAATPVAAPTSVSFNIAPGKTKFPFRSPSQRFDIVDTPVSFVCNISTGQINRYDAYPIAATHAVPPAGTARLLANQVTACTFTYTAGTASRAGLLTISMTVTDPSATGGGNMQVTLLDQVHVLNVP
jgi:MSHA biogenesis protein MshO